MTSQIRVIQVVASLNERIGGPAVSVSRLSRALQEIGVGSSIAALDYPEHGTALAEDADATLVPADLIARRLRGFSPRFAQVLNAMVATGCQIIHNHGLWMYPNFCARVTAMRHGVPLIISPRGMLDSWSLNRSRLKKQLAWVLYERENLRLATAFHATSELERVHIRSCGFKQPVLVIPNGVDVPDGPVHQERSLLERRHPELCNKRWLLFLSRLHPKKGLRDLVKAWKALAPAFPAFHLIIAGPDFDGYGVALEAETRSAGLADRTTFTGMLAGDDKAAALANADLFVLPTYSENFGIAVAEALSYGLPVITTTAAPWSAILERRCGWWIEPGADSLVRTLHEALTTPQASLREMGSRGRDMMLQTYSWHSTATQMKAAYCWIGHKGVMPSFVDV